MEAKAMGLGDGFKILDEFHLELLIIRKNMWQEIIKVIKQFLLCLKIFDPQNVHNMIAIMLDPCFKSLQVVENYVGHGKIIHLAFKYDIKTMIPLLMTSFDQDSVLLPKHVYTIKCGGVL
jgi:hypothetical protein